MSYTGYWGPKTVIHELGHSMFDLKDEYYPGDILAAEAINMTKESDETLVRWKNWVGTDNVGAYQYTCTTGNCDEWYKPHENCIMQYINKSFCPVCTEGIIEKIHDLLPPIDSFTPNNASTINTTSFPLEFELNLIKPEPNTLESEWTLNGDVFANNLDVVSLEEEDLLLGTNTLTAVIVDNSPLLKVDNHETVHVSAVTWTIQHCTLGIETIESVSDNFEISMFPNPVSNVVNLTFESDTIENLKADIISMDGKILLSTSINNFETTLVDVSSFSTGIYLTNFYSNNVLIASKRIVKH